MSLLLRPGLEPVPGYLLGKPLGKGGCGEVWQATGPGGFQVALKFVSLVGRVGTVERRALEVIKGIRHPHLLANHGSWQDQRQLIIAMELADRTLMDRLEEAVAQGLSGIPAPEIFEYFVEAAKGLDFLNEPRHPTGEGGTQGIQHRDIKPQNLLLVGGSIKVADFGLARVLENSKTGGHSGAMTFAYAPPEAFKQKMAQQSDQYSLAITYCQLRGGRLPFRGGIEAVMLGHLQLPPDLSMLPVVEREVVARALAKTPGDRWPSCRAFVQAVMSAEGVEIKSTVVPIDFTWKEPTQPDTASGGPPIKPDRLSELADAEPRTRKRSSYQIAAGALAAVVLLIAAILLFPREKPDAAVGSRTTADGSPDTKRQGLAERPGAEATEIPPAIAVKRPGNEVTKPAEPIVPAVPKPEPDRSAVRSLIERGLALKLGREAQEAISLFDEAIRLDPGNADAHAGRAIAYGRGPSRDIEKGLAEAVKAVRLDPRSALAHAARGHYLELKEPRNMAGALTDANEAIRLDPNLAMAYELRAHVNLDLYVTVSHKAGDLRQVIADSDTALRLDPTNPRIHGVYQYRGDAWMELGNLDQAIADYTALIELRPSDVWTHLHRAWALEKKQEYARAIADCDQVIAMDPTIVVSYQTRSNCHLKLGHTARGNADREKAERLEREAKR